MIRNIILATLLVGLPGCAKEEAAPAAAATDAMASNAVDVDSDTHKVELENSRVRVVRYKASPGYKSNLHTHVGGGYVSLTNAKSRTTLENGDTTGGESSVGDTGAFFEFDGVPHITENVGTTDAEEIMVELMLEDGEPLDEPALDAVDIDPDHHTVEFENERMRIIRMNYPEGYETPEHRHYPGVLVFVSDSIASSAPKGEEAEILRLDAGKAFWVDAAPLPHVTKNVGPDLHAIRIEIKVR